MTEATTTMQTQTTTTACGSCGAALAPDQRYCLHCGAAQAEPRVAYRELIEPAAATAAVPAPAAGPAPFPPPVAVAAAAPLAPRDWTPVIALGGLAALALVLVVGVLIGKSGTPAQPAAAAPQVITVGGAAPAAGDGTTTAGGGGAGAKHRKPAAKDAKQSAKALQDLQSTSGADYQKKSAKLPDTVAIPGKPPPKDDKPAGGGSAGETIG